MTAVATVVLLLMLTLAVCTDALRHKIPNTLTSITLGAGLLLAAASGGAAGLWSACAGALLGGAVLLPLHLYGGLGAGDVKLMGAAGALLGPASAISAALLALVAGALLACVVALTRRRHASTRIHGDATAAVVPAWRAACALRAVRKERFPYAAAIATGVVVELWRCGALGRLLGLPA